MGAQGESGAQDRHPGAPGVLTPAPVSHSPVLVVGVGNPLRGDDGVGVAVVQNLARLALPEDVQIVDGGTLGLGLVNLIEGVRRVLLVDAADLGREPGEHMCWRLAEARLPGEDGHLSVHSAGVRDALLLAQALDCLPEDVVIVGVQPANLEWNTGLSPRVQAALPQITQAILAELGLGAQ